MATIVGTAEIPITADMDRFQRDLHSGLGRADSGISSFATRAAGALAGAFAVGQAVEFFSSAVSGASDLAEAQSRVNTIFGESSGSINEWADGAATDIGLTESAALDAAGTFGNMFTQLGIGAGTAADMSEGIVDLAADFSSFHNADISEVISAQSAAFRGEYDSLQRFLPLINAAAVEQRALEMTGKASTDMLTAQDKALAVNALMYEGAGEAMGDFDRTSGGLANQQRILGAQFENLKTTIGAALMPVLSTVVGFLSRNLIPTFDTVRGAVRQVFEIFANRDFVGGPFAEDSPFIARVFQVRDAIAGLWEKVQPFIEWVRANWQPVLAGVAVGLGLLFAPITTVVGGLALLYFKFEGVRNVVDTVVTFLTTVAWPAIQGFTQSVIDVFSELVAWVRTHWAAISEAIGHVIAVVQDIINVFVAAVQTAWRLFGDEILAVARAVWGFIQSTVENAINFIRSIIETVLALINGDWGEAWEGIKGIVSAVWDQIKNIVGLAIEAVKAGISAALDGLRAVWRIGWDAMKAVVTGIWDGMVDVFQGVINGIIGGLEWGINRAIDLVNMAIDAVDTALGPWINFGEIGHVSLPRIGETSAAPSGPGIIHAFDNGGVMPGPRGVHQLALVAGGETILPTHKASSFELGAGRDEEFYDRMADRMARRYAQTLRHEQRSA